MERIEYRRTVNDFVNNEVDRLEKAFAQVRNQGDIAIDYYTIGKDVKTMNEEAVLLDLSTLVDEELATLKSWNERVIVVNDEVRSNLNDYMYKQFAKLFQSVEDKQFFHNINAQIEDAIFSIGSNFEQIDYRWLSLISDGDVYNVYRDYAEDHGYTALDDMFDIIYRQFESEWEEIVETYIESLGYEYTIGFNIFTNGIVINCNIALITYLSESFF
jgi:hypothetical protein